MFIKIRPSYIILVAILLVSFLIRFSAYQYPYEREEANRDYLVAHHIITHKEVLLSGYNNTVLGEDLKNSPLYFYVLAGFLLIQDNIVFLGLTNILLQILTIFIIFKLSEKLFDTKTALLSAFLFSISGLSFYQSAQMWQPWFMQPFINLSYLLLLYAYQKKKYLFLLGSIILFSFAGAIHNSPFILTPIFSVLIVVVLKKKHANYLQYIGAFLMFFMSLLLFYFPLLIYFMRYEVNIIQILTSRFPAPPIDSIILNFFGYLYFFINTSLLQKGHHWIFYVFLLITIGIVTYYFLYKKDRKKKHILLILALCIIEFLFVITIVDPSKFTRTYIHHFTPIYGLFIILISRAFIIGYKENAILKYVILFIIAFYTGSFISLCIESTTRTRNLNQNLAPSVAAIKKTVLDIKKTKNYEKFDFFSLESSYIGHGHQSNAFIWVPLERDLGIKFTRVSDTDFRSYTEIDTKDNKYIFLVCPPSSQVTYNKCMQEFMTKYNGFIFAENIYNGPISAVNLMINPKL